MSKKVLSQLEEVANAYTYIDNEPCATEITKIIVKCRDEGIHIIDAIREARILTNTIKEKLMQEIETHKDISLLAKERTDERLKIFMRFTAIYGVGPKTAHDWIARGCRTLGDIKKRLKELKLTRNQILGLAFYKTLQEPITRANIDKIMNKFGPIINSVAPDAIYEVAGSYRRGKSTSGDIDIIICSRKNCIAEINREIELKYIPRYNKLSEGEHRISFTFRYNEGQHIIVDLLYSTRAALAPALLYFTGSWLFNQEMRAWAKRKGYTLNQYGLFDASSGKEIIARTEKSIFKILGLKYLAPEERICSITPL